jgi:hypothetical protein
VGGNHTFDIYLILYLPKLRSTGLTLNLRWGKTKLNE